MLHAVFLRPKTVLQYFVCIFSHDDFSCRAKVSQQVLFLSSELGPYSAIDPYVKPCFPPEMTALTGTPVLIDNEEIQTE
jgi:hypothetical protein